MSSQANLPNREITVKEATGLADWTRSDEYHNARLIKPDSHLDNVNKVAEENGLPPIAVSDAQGKFLHLLARSIQAKRIIEVGTLAGYSTIWLAKAVPEGGRVVTFELEEKHAQVALSNITKAGLENKVFIIQGPASENLPELTEDGTYDLAFIDADKAGNLTYFKHAKRLVRSGGVIIVDNVVRNGRVARPEITNDENVDGVRRLLEYIKDDKEVEATTLATVGTKGYDGLLYALKL